MESQNLLFRIKLGADPEGHFGRGYRNVVALDAD